jgi:glycosyltransferase involved in cell wall biosynthesis
MPVYNEAATVERAVEEVLSTELPAAFELIVVDDGSTDGSRELLERMDWPDNARLFHHDSNRGKGAAVQTALARARGEFATIFDADVEYDPADIALLLPPLLEGRTNAVFGVRAFDGYTSHSFLYVLGNKGVTLAANVLFNVYLRDIMTCHKAIRTDVFQSLRLSARGFDIEPEITARLLQAGERIYEVPISYRARSTEEGKKLAAADGFRVLRTLIRCRLSGGAHLSASTRRGAAAAAGAQADAAGNGSLPDASGSGSSEPLRR